MTPTLSASVSRFCLEPKLCGMVDIKLALALNSNNLPLESALFLKLLLLLLLMIKKMILN